MTRRISLLYISYLLSLISYFFFPLSAHAVVDCTTVPKPFSGPQYQSIIDNGNECGLPTLERQLKELETSSVVCLDNPTLLVNTIGFDPNADKENILSLFKNQLDGNTVIDLISYDSFAIKNDKLQKIEDDENLGILAKLGKAVTLPDYFDASLYDALCVYEGYFDRTECAQKLDSLTPSQKENLLASGGWWQFASRLEDQFAAKKERAKQIVACAQNNADPLLPCDQPYIIRKNEEKTSLDLAKEIVNMDYEDFLSASPKDRMTILSLRESRALSAVYLVIRKNTDPSRIFVLSLSNLLDTQYGPANPNATENPQSNQSTQTKIVTTENMMIRKSYIPNVHKTTARAQELYKLLNRRETGEEGIENINKRIGSDLSGYSSINEAIAGKISAANLNCSDSSFTYQTTGSQDTYPKTGEGGGLFDLFVTVKGLWTDLFANDQADQIDNLYEAYLIAPTQELAELMAQDINSPLPLMVKKEYQQSAQEETFLPHQLSDKPPSVGVDTTKIEQIEVPCPDGLIGPCYADEVKEYEINYAANKNLEGPLPGGEATNWMLYLKGKLAWRKGSEEHFSSTCYAQELSQKANSGLLASLGSTLFELLGRTNNSNLTNCPDDFTAATSTTPLSGDICAVASEYDIPCCQLEGIMRQESGYGTEYYRPGTSSCPDAPENCCNGIGCGPAQITCGQINLFSGNDQLNVCDPVDSAILLSRAMKLKLCIAAKECNSHDYEKEKSKLDKYNVNDGDYTAAAYFNGLQNGCTLSGCSQFRWGEGKTYCDSVASFCTTGDILPSVSDMNFCEACNVELENSGVPPMSCP
jgi:hypothetical protein